MNFFLWFRYESIETENQGILYPVMNQVCVPESQIYNVVHALENNGTTYFYQDLVDVPVYK